MGARLDTLQAAVLNVKIDHYDTDILRRQNAAAKYTALLKGNIIVPFVEDYNTSVWAQYSIRVSRRDEIQNSLKELGIPTAVHYPKPLHLQKCFEYLDHKLGDFPVSEKVSNEIMSLPMNPYLTENEQEYICKELLNVIENIK
jgi:UDP-2-acetamido-2-deoxy-ribo-hexuluronate aminotransferase